ncbi:hypothetical protein NDU88_005761 [Pleurodeles waltl]|uniref:Uncharacterized protein n=1 Tax=Pleurodeles waltl TaxID=8319 RepID=A0AAV7PGI5_PLEWA|nr:hypothetical protein NDU88_005761 [Pleurodeles waltl]
MPALPPWCGSRPVADTREGVCSQLSSNAAIDSSDWRCSRTTEESVPRCRDDNEDAANPMTPDIQIPGRVKGEKGLRRGEGEEEDAEKLEETADSGEEPTERGAGSWKPRRSQGGSGPRERTKTATSQEGHG